MLVSRPVGPSKPRAVTMPLPAVSCRRWNSGVALAGGNSPLVTAPVSSNRAVDGHPAPLFKSENTLTGEGTLLAGISPDLLSFPDSINGDAIDLADACFEIVD